jgi:NhaP-type Na+/H+ or K+/H+ antiporter
MDSALYAAALTIGVGMVVQVVAQRIRIPGIVALLVAGIAVGPDGLAMLNPDALGQAAPDLIGLAVSVILFEGGLGLRPVELAEQRHTLLRLLTLGAAISMVIGTLAARLVLGVSWSIASLYGALMIVTGPTVVTPILARLRLDHTVRELLISEGVLIDPVGAIVAIVVAEYVVGHTPAWGALWLVPLRLGTGVLVGGAAGLVTSFVLDRGWVADHLRNPFVLAVVIFSAAVASRASSEAGLMAAVTQGVVIGNSRVRELGRMRQFKEEITVLLLSFIFVLLSADLRLAEVRGLGWPALAVVGIVAWIGRPATVFLSTWGSPFTLRQRLFVSWMCPRGIVAASVAGLFAILLAQAGISDGGRLEALVFITVAVTVTLQGVSAGWVARLLRVDTPTLRGTVLVGADAFGRCVARLLNERGRPVVLIDQSPVHCREARVEGLPAYAGDALSVETLEEAGTWYADTFLAMTTNQELNLLITQLVRNNFRVERILAVAEREPRELGAVPFPGRFPGVDEVNHSLRVHRLKTVVVDPGEWAGHQLGEMPFAAGEFAVLIEHRDQVYVAASDHVLSPGDRLICLAPSADPPAA